LGEQSSRFFDIRVAEAVTLGGQYFIKQTFEFLNENGYPVRYGDTDSAFFVLKDANKLPELISGIKERCKNLAINQFNADISHLEVDYDKGFNKFIILAKKRYAGSLCYLDGRTLDGVLYVAGLEYKRTDQCPYLKKKQKELLEILLGSKPFSLGEAKDFINVAKRYIFQGDVSVDDITFGKKLTKDVSEYKAKTMHLKVVAEMTGDNEEVWVGDKVMYFIEGIDANGKPIPRPISKYTGKFSQVYYWNNLIYPPLMRILQVVYRDIDWSAYEVKTTGKRKNAEIGRMALW
jgi:DNA polymerase-2